MHLNNGRKKMNEYVRKRIEEMSIDFTSVQSVVDTEGEIVMAEKIYDTMSEIDYYKKAGVYKEIDGRQDIAKVEADLAAVLEA